MRVELVVEIVRYSLCSFLHLQTRAIAQRQRGEKEAEARSESGEEEEVKLSISTHCLLFVLMRTLRFD